MVATIRNTETTTLLARMGRLTLALTLAAGLALASASVAAADESAPVAPNPHDVALLRALLGIAPVPAPAATDTAPAVTQTTATGPVQPRGEATTAKSAAPATPTGEHASVSAHESSTTDDHAVVAAEDSGLTGTTSEHLARAILAAKLASQRIQIASR